MLEVGESNFIRLTGVLFSLESSLERTGNRICDSTITSKRVAQLRAWLVEHHAARWDQQIKADMQGGKLDALLPDVEREYLSGPIAPL